MFKTPGKLRGRTPRTTRKRDALGTRQPLTDILAPNVPAQPSAQKSAFLDKVHQFQIAEDAENQPPAARPTSRGKSPQRVGKPGNTDSGYHGMTEDEMEIDNRTETATEISGQQSLVQKVPLRDNQGPAQRIPETVAEVRDGDTSGDSFMSAKEDLTSRNASKGQLREEEMADEMEVDHIDWADKANTQGGDVEMAEQDEEAPTAEAEVMTEDQDQDQDAASETSGASSPEKPLQRKSSFTFTALPPRDPLGAKRSIGARNSQIDAARTSTLGRSFGAKSFGVAQDDEDEYAQEKPEESKAHSKTSTQLLHERINMLGKTKEPRPSKSIAQTVLNAQPAYPQLPAASESRSAAAPVDDDEDDDDWIAPVKPAQSQAAEPSPARPPMHQKSISTTAIPSPRPNLDQDARQAKAISVSNPNFAYAIGEIQSTTPAGSPPSKKHHDGPLSASKNKLYSVLKSAKSIFASSASASAAAKLEAHNTPTKSPRCEPSNESKTAAVLNMPGAMYSHQSFPDPPKSPTRSMISLVSKSPSRKTRSSNESDKKREKELKAQQKAADELEKAREKERQKAAKQQEKEKAKAQRNEPANTEKELPRPPTAESEQEQEELEQPVPAQQKQQPKSLLPGGKLRAPGRLAKPTRAEPAQPSRPAPVSIRVASQSQRLGQGPPASAFSKSQHESKAQGRPPTAGSTRPGSAQGSVRGSAAPQNARVKALEAAQRKKEADERAAQKKLEQKRELERKRAAKAEDERRAEEERRAAEQARIQEAKLAAQRQAEKQALEQRRKDEARHEAQRRQEEEKRAKAAQDLAEAIKRERAQETQKATRGDMGGTLRHMVKHTVPDYGQSRPPPQYNQSKPAKRAWDPADDEPAHYHPQPPQRPGMQRGPPSYQQQDAKRRRTNEEEPPMHQPPRSSVMAPPMRPSAMRKVSTHFSLIVLTEPMLTWVRSLLPTSSRMATLMLHHQHLTMPTDMDQACLRRLSPLSTNCSILAPKRAWPTTLVRWYRSQMPAYPSPRTRMAKQLSTTTIPKPGGTRTCTPVSNQQDQTNTKHPPVQHKPPNPPSPPPSTPKATTSNSRTSPPTAKTKTPRTKTTREPSAPPLGSRLPLSVICSRSSSWSILRRCLGLLAS